MSEERYRDPADDPPDATPASNDAPAAVAEGTSAELQRERDDYYDRLLRKTAEFDNYRKRVEKTRREQADESVLGLLRDILAVVDDFDIALNVDAGKGGAAYRKGVELIHAKLQDLLAKYNVKAIDAVGADFDPNLHQAVIHEESPDHREGEVIEELRKGYMIGDRLLRPSMVKVAKA
jgi:molecular chaperone GrpE